MTEAEIRSALMELLEPMLEEAGVTEDALDVNTSLIDVGVIDSFNLVELLMSLQNKIGADIDFMELTPDDFASIHGLVSVAHSAVSA